jgi:uncharacterized membrane protein (DUF106 family)
VSTINAIIGRTFDLIFTPLALLPPFWGLAVMSLVTAVVMLLVYRKTSNQERLAQVKRSIHAAIFEIRLFNDDLGAIWRAQLELLRNNLTYLRLSLVPMLWMIVPLTLLVAQLQFYYGYEGLTPREPVLVKVQVKDSGAKFGGSGVATLEPVQPIRFDTPTIWLPGARELVWRLSPQDAGDYELRINVGQETFTKTLNSTPGVARRSPVRLEQGFVNQLLYPSEAPLPSSGPVSAISIAYPEREIDVLGWRIHWMIVYFALSMIFAFALRKPFNVTI